MNRNVMNRNVKKSVGIAAIVAALAAGSFSLIARAEEAPREIPAPALDEPAGQRGAETVVLAGGCFWGVQGVFEHVKGVTRAVSGYAGGEAATAHYEITGRGDTGHAESVQVTFNPAEISLGHILQIYFSVAHDPTQLNRQGPDRGSQYRSAIFPASDEQAKIARAYIAQLNQARIYQAAIVTKIEPDRIFYPAESYHQDFLARNPTYPYIRINDLPKIAALKQLYPGVYRDDPVLVGDAMR
ncbi:peptide-methionine (S)-S-oxide reductase MsrA [Rhodoblastus sp.]|jgi:peptide-methionine (S)-S-oxide reductase|uniref:peptide-methionine (S)-S-oxide reductase MsrA n=1 Tax=Rhodoblastus sp. TaxID=1962975 RepID=UPI0025DF8895|nr:peptide-methionine (S)-S-oxide reductase MsrA [Rhodoblastus sp.]